MIGTRLQERYVLEGELGRGGRGVVYRAWDPSLQRHVAVKLLPPKRLDREAEARFEREALAIARMDHPSIVPIYDFGRHGDTLFFVMPLVEGRTLKALIRAGALDLGEVLRIVAQAAEALDYSHLRGIVHRDVKPSNLMVTGSGADLRVRVMDFGMARTDDQSRLTETGNLPGTLFYLSPEQVLSKPLDGRADLYSLGAALYECLAGSPPFTGPVYAVLYRIVHEALPALPATVSGTGETIDPALERLVASCLAKEPAGRPARGRDLAAALSALAPGLDSTFARRRAENPEPPAALAEPPRPAPAREPIVGREAELAELDRRLLAALAGECQLALVLGEAGVGKTRLLEELESRAQEHGWRVLRGRFSGREQAFPHQGLSGLVQDFFRPRTDSGSSNVIPSPPIPEMDDLAPALLETFPSLSEIEELRAATEKGSAQGPAASGSTHHRPPQVFELLARTLARLASGRPTLFLLENLHNGIASLEALEYLVRRLGPTPTIFVATLRPAEIGDETPYAELLRSFGDDPRFGQMHLGPLAGESFRTFVERLLDGGQLAPALVAKLEEATEGNPLFARELVGALRESGELGVGDEGCWELAASAAPLAGTLPATVQQTVARRLERLERGPREVLAIASVLGRSFAERDLAELVAEQPELARALDPALDALVRQGILEEERKARSDRLAFSSTVVRDVLYYGLSRHRRRALHRRHAERLEQRHAERLERALPQLVYHFSRGGSAEKTVRYALQLARRSLEVSSPEDAMQAADIALERVEAGAAVSPEPLEGELHEILARAHSALGNLQRALEEAERAYRVFELAGSHGAAAQTAMLLAETAWRGQRVDDARLWTERGAHLARRCDAPETLRRLLTLGATLANLRGEHAEAQALLEEVERLAPQPEMTDEAPPQRGGTLITALPYRVGSLDPGRFATDGEAEIATNVFETLLRSDEDGHLLPGLCESWRAEPDGRTFTLELRSEVAFTDGTPLSAIAVKTAFERSARLRSADPAPACAALDGFDAFLAGAEPGIRGLVADAGGSLVCRLTAPLPIFPALLTDNRTALALDARGGIGAGPVGTGPFRIVRAEPSEVILERNPAFRHGSPPLVDRLVFRCGLSASEIAVGLRTGELDLGRDLLPEDLEEILRDPRRRWGWVETTRKNVYFALFNQRGPHTHRSALRRALAGVVVTTDLVWRTLGRFAQPAVGLIPPGVLGHDPGRRPRHLTSAAARALLDDQGLATPIVLRAAVHPLLQDRYASLTQALLANWAGLGVEVEVVTPTMETFLRSYRESDEIDVLIGRWNTDYDDADNFTYVFHSRDGIFRRYCASAQLDDLLARARQERRGPNRPALYGQLEDHLAERAALVPLFHDIDYRVASPEVRGLRLRNTYPYVDYTLLGKAPEQVEASSSSLILRREPGRLGGLHVPIPTRVTSIDPIDTIYADQLEVLSPVFETLTRLDDGARVVPWLAESVVVGDGGRSYRFRLRPEVRYHDGRRLSVRDVRYSFERLLQAPASPLHDALEPIRGATAVRCGEARELAGFRILSPTELVVELERPVPFFPAILSHPALAIVAEGSATFDASWRGGTCGTGPYRVLRLEPGERLDLERNPHYWRPDLPRTERLSFHLGTTSEQALAGLRSGRFTLAGQLAPTDIAELRRDPVFSRSFRESPRLSTYFLALDTRRGPFADLELRRAFAAALQVDELIQEETAGLSSRARGLLPPGLLGWEHHPTPPLSSSPAPSSSPPAPGGRQLAGLELRIGALPSYLGPYSGLWSRLCAEMTGLGLVLDGVDRELPAPIDLARGVEIDLAALRWIADYPDADTFISYLLSAQARWFCEGGGGAELEILGERGRRETDPALRHAIYRQIEELLARECPLVPLFHEQTYRFHQPQLSGLKLSLAVPEIRYEELMLEL